MTPTERQELFTRIYRNNEWKGQHSRSGPGSDPENIMPVRSGLLFCLALMFPEPKSPLPSMLLPPDAPVVLDIPCGDFSLFCQVLPRHIRYIGADIVPELVDRNWDRVFLPYEAFLVKDLLTDDLPDCDMLICRDCLPHFSYEDIWQALKNICRTNARYLMTTTFFAHQNTDIETGGWRPLNLQAPPFSFPAPEIAISENCTVAGGQYADKTLSIWQRSNIHLLIDSHFNSYTSHFPLPSSLPNQ